MRRPTVTPLLQTDPICGGRAAPAAANPDGQVALADVSREWLAAMARDVDACLSDPRFLRQAKVQIDALVAGQRAIGRADRLNHDVVYEQGTLKVRRYRNKSAASALTPVVLCTSLVNRPSILDFHPDRSVIDQLLRQDLDIYLIDWGTPGSEDAGLRLQDYIGCKLKAVIDLASRDAGSSEVNLMGYCMGGTMSAAYAALHPRQIRNLVLVAAPIDFAKQEGLLSLWSRPEWFDVDGLVDAYGNCPGWFLRACFQMTNPVENYFGKYVKLLEKIHDAAFLELFFAMEQWINDSIPMAGETFREFVKLFYQENCLVKGQFAVDGAVVRLEEIVCPLLVLVAEDDKLVPLESALALKERVGSPEVQTMSTAAGHIGLAVGSAAHSQLWPAVASWIVDRSTARSGDS